MNTDTRDAIDSRRGRSPRNSLQRIRSALLYFFVLLAVAVGAHAQVQLEALDRGFIARRGVDTNKDGTLTSTQVYVGWRLLATDPAGLAFNLYRTIGAGAAVKLNASPLATTTDYVDTPSDFTQSLTYEVRRVVGGVEVAGGGGTATLPAGAATQHYLDIPLIPPPDGTSPPISDGTAGGPYSYGANDASAADLDGDGQLEIILKWDPTNAKDNSQAGFTGNTYLDAYRLDGTRLWRINLGPNIRSGAHYMDFMCFDFDGDGKAEVMCRTAPGSIDGTGAYVGGAAKWQTGGSSPLRPAVLQARPAFNNTDDYRATGPNGANGYVLEGPEFLTVFNGETGAEMATVNYDPPRDPDATTFAGAEYPGSTRINTVWGDGYGNRIDRFLAGVAYCDGQRPTGVFCRGYYTRSFLIAWDWRGGQLTERWRFDSNTWGSSYNGNGDHSLSIGDVDNDGKQEVIYGAMVIDDDGTPLHNTTLGHGDALHVGDFDPDRPGLEIFTIQERVDNQGWHFRNAWTGEVYWSKPTTPGSDEGPGRALAADIDPTRRGWETWTAGGGVGGLHDARGNRITTNTPSSCNFTVYWDDDRLCELLNSNRVFKWNHTNNSTGTMLVANGASSINGTKSTPCLSADLLGDWREEIVFRQSDNLALRIYTTTIKATDRRVTFLHDLQYRVAVAWQNTGYNQPPHPGYNILEPATVPFLQGPLRRWNAAGSSGTWDAATANWQDAAGAAATFATGNSVLFEQSDTATAVTLSGALQPAEVFVQAAKNFTFSGAGSLAGAARLTKGGTGTLTLSSANSHTGGTVIGGGTLALGGDSAGTELPAALGTGPVQISNGQLRLGGAAGAVVTYNIPNSITLDTEGTIFAVDGRQNLNGTLTIPSNSFGLLMTQYSTKDIYVQGVLQGTGPLLINDSTSSGSSHGMVHFSNGANTYSGILTISASASGTSGGRLAVDHATTLRLAQVNNLSNRSDTGFSFTVPGVEFGSLDGSGNFALPTGSLTVGVDNRTSDYTGVISGGGSFIKTGSGNFILLGVNTFTAGLGVHQGTLTPLTAAAASLTGTMVAASDTMTGLTSTAGLVIGQRVSGTGIPSGTVISAIPSATSLTLSADSTSSGTRTYTFSAAKGFGNASSMTVLGGTLALSNSSGTVAGVVTLQSGAISGAGSRLTATGFQMQSGTVAAVLASAGGLTKTTSGTVTLNAANAYTGPTAISAGMLTLGVNEALNAASLVSITAGATLNVNGKADTIAGLGGAGSVTLGGGALTLATTGAATFTGSISGAGTLTKSGPATQTLGGAQTYTGATVVAAGTLALSGTLTNSSTVEVLSGATLHLTGTCTVQTVTIRAGGTLTGDGTINGTLIIEGLAAISTGPGTDLRVNGSVTNTGTLRLTNGTSLDVTGTFTNNGTLDVMTGAGPLPPSLVNNGVVLDASAVKVSTLEVTPANVTITIQSYTGHAYQLQKRANLAAGTWENVGAAQTGTQGVLTFTDATSGTEAFYRILVST